MAARGRHDLTRCSWEWGWRGDGYTVGKDRVTTPSLTHKGLVLLISSPQRVLFVAHNISPGKKAGGAAVVAPL